MKYATIASGSTGNCLFVRGGKTRLLVDCGISAARITKGLLSLDEDVRKIDAILITHEHRDHICGLATMCKKYLIPVYASPKTWQCLTDVVPDFLRYTYTQQQSIGEIDVEYFAISHDAVQPVGMVFSHQQKRLGVVTDSGTITRGMQAALCDLDGLVMEANHSLTMLQNGPYPAFLKQRVAGDCGHLSNQQSAQLLQLVCRNKTPQITLAHLSETNNQPAVALREIRAELAALGCDQPPEMSVASPTLVHPLVEI